MKALTKLLSSLKITLILLSILAISASVATFLENDYGSDSAKALVYYSWWYIAILVLTALNLLLVIFKYKMWRHLPRFIFHIAFIIIGIGAFTTHYFGQEGVIHIREGQAENRVLSTQAYLHIIIEKNGKKYYQEFLTNFTPISGNSFKKVIGFSGDELRVELTDYKISKQGRVAVGILKLKVCNKKLCKELSLIGKGGAKGFEKSVELNGVNVILEYGAEVIKLPFKVELIDFILTRYPGSMAPSFYESRVKVIDVTKSFNYKIYMNHTLEYKGYKFFQSSYDKDERGTILSVSKDPGKLVTYIGYLLLAFGLLLNLFDRKSRFAKLLTYIQKSSAILLLFTILPLHAYTVDDFNNYLPQFKAESLKSAKAFAKLLVQSPMGRIEPVNSLNSKFIYKIHKSLSYKGLNQDQIVLGMMSRPELWRFAKLIKVTSPKLKSVLGVKSKYISYSNAFNGKSGYKLKEYVEKANRIMPQERGTFERELISLDEKLNIINSIFYANYYRIYPLPDDPKFTWYNPLEAMNKFAKPLNEKVASLTHNFIDNTIASNWRGVGNAIEQIAHYQQKYGAKIIPKKQKIEMEILYNNLNIFPKLIGVYIGFGFLLVVLGFIAIFSKRRWIEIVTLLSLVLLFMLFLLHTFGLGLRWYISSHAPWSDAYESLLYISWSAMLAGLLLFRKHLLALGSTLIVAGIFLFTAHLSNIDPQITNLVPVLKSYWLTIHVSVITASYGFLGVGAMLGFLVLLLFIIRKYSTQKIDNAIYKLSATIEASLILGLSLLTIGNFIGGVWANESWGRYWGWDPKETWAYISILVYTIVLHLRLIPKFDKPYILALGAYLAFSSIIMTYFGVNFYLSGMHSYASGEPMPIPHWVWWMSLISLIVILLSFRNRDLKRLKL